MEPSVSTTRQIILLYRLVDKLLPGTFSSMARSRGRDGGREWRPPPWREVFQGRRGMLTMGLLLLEALVAVEALVVTTIMPAIRRDLGGLQFYGWAFSAFSLATFASIPIAGRATDRYGARRLLALMFVVYLLGLAISGLAPNMPVLVLGRFVQGCGAGAFYSVSLGTVAKSYPERIRPRVLALLASMWILPGLVGPPLGALFAATIGWRWVFVAPLPLLLIIALLILPSMPDVAPEVEAGRVPIRWPVLLMVGAGVFLAGLTQPSWWSAGLIPLGLVLGLPALVRIAPSGFLRAARGLPATAVAAFLLSACFFAVDGFVPLLLTGIRHLSIGEAGIVVTIATLTWAAGSWWQSRNVGRFASSTLVAGGTGLVIVGTLAVSAALFSVPIALPYVGWGVAGLGMGVAFPTIPLAAMAQASGGMEAGELSSILLTDTLGVGIGAGLGGASIALAKSAGAGLRAGIAGAFAIGLVAALVLLAVSRRLPRGAPVDSTG
jgi:MFS family permease